MSGDHLLPPEIWYQILTNLPVKSVVRFRCVCKTWYSLISYPNFVSDHTAQTLNQSTSNRVLLHRCERATGLYRFSSHDDSFVESHEHNELSLGFSIVGSCKGLVALFRPYYSGNGMENFLIWNPSVRKLIQLPPRSSLFFSRACHLLGFGFDSDSSDYKLLRVVYHEGTPSNSEIFDMRKGVWRSLSSPMPPCPVHDSGLYLNGALHWLGDKLSFNLPLLSFTYFSLLSFNLSTEVFQVMKIPLELPFSGHSSVLQINGLLSLAVLNDEHWEGVRCSVWSMKEYGVTESWTRLFFNIVLPCDLHSPLLFLDNDHVLIQDRRGWSNDYNVLVLYNCASETSRALPSTNDRIFKACLYEESLVLL